LQEIKLEKSDSTRHKTLQYMFKSIDREEMHVHVEHEFESLDKRLELEKALTLL
jgi:hypothetical protein